MRILSKTILLFFCFTSFVFSFSDQTTTERIIKENKSFIDFINISMTNLGAKPQEVDNFFKIYQVHFNGEVAFLQADYKRAFKSIYSSQKDQVELFSIVLTDYYLDSTKNILDKMAPHIIKSKNQLARLYLTLGYRDRAVSRNTQKIADASNPKLYSYKIHHYIEAIKLCRRALRYGLLALFESQDLDTKRYIYNHLFEIEREGGNFFYTRFLNKEDKDFVKELNNNFNAYNESYEKQLAEIKKQSEMAATVKDDKTKRINFSDITFEKKVERKVRFRYEKRTAEHLRDGDFQRADDIIRKYVTDFNYKLIQATLEVLKTKEKNKTKLDYDRLIIHHSDNDQRLLKKTILEGFSSRVRVVDDIKPLKDEKNTIDDKEKEKSSENSAEAPAPEEENKDSK